MSRAKQATDVQKGYTMCDCISSQANAWWLQAGTSWVVSTQLCDATAYSGGSLEFCTGVGASGADLIGAQGAMVVFPAYQAHRVTPVVRGQRLSLVAWLDGPPYR